ncbi:MAG TPA: type III-B CRISPR-associated protein Cas10/Cmr2 [Verrucomicrobiota bacterium]|nr:type III-B CRISPR-associated protein Cas10/Cmr2 [Verrucomicrobiota bacterium]HNT14580.1 type III-B CRISPR-associated protein Cas10/Cmr2 [Verrucomicrobiota bacterium]
MNHALLKIQIGPVQDFIAQARSTRDLWSGSYLLSWLVASGLHALAAELAKYGIENPWESIMFPAVVNQPLLRWRSQNAGLLDNLVGVGDRGGLSRCRILEGETSGLLTPNIPNLFLARVPHDPARTPSTDLPNLALASLPGGGDPARSIANAVESAIGREWKAISTVCWQFALDHGLVTTAEEPRFEAQRDRFLTISWQFTPALSLPEDLGRISDLIAPTKWPRTNWEKVADRLHEHEEELKAARQDGRSAEECAYALTTGLNAWQLDAIRQTRNFRGWNSGRWFTGDDCDKDFLNGREERILGGRAWWDAQVKDIKKDGELIRALLRERHKADILGATSLVKRTWHIAWLTEKLGLPASHRKGHMIIPSTWHIARHDPHKDEAADLDDAVEGLPEDRRGRSYFAVLAMDGDEMGKWIGGEKIAKPLSADYHQEISRRLSNFALRVAGKLIAEFDGHLIYAGGDDVLALLPADQALGCAYALRQAFRGETSGSLPGLAAKISAAFAATSALDMPGKLPAHFLAGSPLDVSVGIAIAHFKSPLQDVVHEAQAAERRAKHPKELDRSAVAITLMKRSGEISEWGCKWEQRGPEAFFAMLAALRTGVVSGKFPHRIIELVARYQTDEPGKLGGTSPASGFDLVVTQILKSEIGTVAGRQKGPNYSQPRVSIVQQAIGDYLDSIPGTARKVRALIGLCQTVAFTHRTADAAPAQPPAERQPV